MPENNCVTQLSVADVNRDLSFLQANNVTAFRIEYDKAQRKLAVLQKRKSDLAIMMGSIKARMYKNYSSEYVVSVLKPDLYQTVEPIQAYSSERYQKSGPHQSVSYDLHQLTQRVPGLLEMRKELDRVNGEYLYVQSQIRLYTVRMNMYKDKLTDNERRGTGITSQQLEADRAQQSRKTSLQYLYQVALMFRELSTDQNGKRAYPQNDKKTMTDLYNLAKLFGSQAPSFPNLMTGNPRLDFNDPGCDGNLLLIQKQLTKVQISGKTDLVEPEVDKFKNSLNTTIQDQRNSVGLFRRVTEPPVGAKMAELNPTYSKAMVNVFGRVYVSSWTYPNLEGAARDWWVKQVAATNLGLPKCSPETPSASDTKITDQEVSKAAAVTAATSQIQASDAKAQTEVSKPSKTLAEVRAAVATEWPSTIRALGESYQKRDNAKELTAEEEWKINGVVFYSYCIGESGLLSAAARLQNTLTQMVLEGSATSDQQKTILDEVVAYIESLNWFVPSVR